MSPTPTADLASFVAGMDADQLPAAVREAAAAHVVDLLGGMTIGGSLPEMAKLIGWFADRGPAEATVPGFGTRFAAPEAAGLSAALSHAGETDSIHSVSTICVGAVTIPSLLAVAEARGVPGTRAIAAIVAGMEVAVRVGTAMGSSRLLGRGWWPTALFGGAGAAATASVALGLDATEVRNAISLALVQTGGAGVGAQEAPESRSLLCANVVRHGVEAALLAQAGVEGPAEPIVADRGIKDAFQEEPDPSLLLAGLGEHWAILETSIKTFPCALQAQSALDALRTLIRNTGVEPGNIQEIVIALPDAMKRIVDRPAPPSSRLGAVASLQFLSAALLVDGEVTVPRFDEGNRRDEQVLALMPKVRIVHEPAFDERFPAAWPARVTLRHVGGTAEEEVAVPPGHPDRPLDMEGLVAKFRDLAGDRLGSDAMDLVTLIRGFGELDDVAVVPRRLDAALRN